MFPEVARQAVDFGIKNYLRFFLKRSNNVAPKVIYAGQAPVLGEFATGGRVKLLSLSRKYPEQGLSGNILYLVTSGLPKGAVQWARVCKEKGIKVVVNQNGIAFPAWANDSDRERINFRNKQILECADFVVYQSEFCKLGVQKWVGFEPANGQIIYNPVDTEKFKLASKKSENLCLLLMGSHRHAERVEIAIEALSILLKTSKNVHLKIAGPLAWPAASESIRKKIETLGVQNHVELLGPYTQQEAPEIYQSADILLHLQDKDASPTVPLEGLACGLQVVAPKSGGLPELIPEDCGALLKVKEGWDEFYLPSAGEIAAAIQKISPVSNEKREWAHQWVKEKFSATDWVNQHEKIFEKLLRG